MYGHVYIYILSLVEMNTENNIKNGLLEGWFSQRKETVYTLDKEIKIIKGNSA